MSSYLWLIWYCIKFYLIGIYALLIELFYNASKKNIEKIQQVEDGMVAIVTGGASGIGYQVTRKLALKNVYVIIASRNEREAAEAISRIQAEKSDVKVEFLPLDLASFKSVEMFAKDFRALDMPLHILVNNAGVMLVPYMETDDGLESHFQVNFLSHLYLTCLLIDIIKETGKQDRCSRIINVSSIVHRVADVTDIQPRIEEDDLYSSHAAYASSKLAIILSSYLLGEGLKGSNFQVTVNCIHPGVVNSNLYSNVHWSVRWVMDIMRHCFFKTTSEAAEDIISLALSSKVEGHTGGYYENEKFVQSKGCTYSTTFQKNLWRMANQLVDIKI